MEHVVWSAARRLAVVVAAALALVGVRELTAGGAYVGPMPGAAGGLALALLASSLVPLALAARSLRRAARMPPDGPAPASVYRENARPRRGHASVDAAREVAEAHAVHAAAIAFLLLSLAAALTVVAAASR